jgi:hypothetical protein
MNTTDAVLNEIAQHGARLTVLNFHGCKGYSTSQALSLTRSLSALQRFDVNHSNDIFTAAVLDAWKARTPGLYVDTDGRMNAGFYRSLDL